jgi:hypothetical protein
MKKEGVYQGLTYQKDCACGKLYLTINEDDNGEVVQIFSTIGKSGTCVRCSTEIVSRMLVRLIKKKADMTKTLNDLSGAICQHSSEDTMTCYQQMGAILKEHFARVK